MPFERLGDGPHWWSLAAMGFSTFFWLALLGVLVWAASRYLGRRQSEPVPVVDAEPSAVELLRRRYVMGEIDVETFDAMLHHLMVTERGSPSRYEESSARGPIL
jgi:uncharacterized membrane protein